MNDFVKLNREKSGLVHAGQKDSHTLLFKFSNELSMHNALSRGT